MKRPILDHGYLEFVERWGSDEAIVIAARMSTGKGFLGWARLIRCTVCGIEWECENKPAVCNHGRCVNSPTVEVHPGDSRLLAYLWRHKHTTPFEVPGMTVEVSCPVVVVWQWVRHRTMTYNILSGRYAEMPGDDYLPNAGRLLKPCGDNRQAGLAEGAPKLSEENADKWLQKLAHAYHVADEAYRDGLAVGVPKELARLVLPFGRYTRMRVTANLWNWLRFLTLRIAPDSQLEIRVYANAVGGLIAEHFPRTWALFHSKDTP